MCTRGARLAGRRETWHRKGKLREPALIIATWNVNSVRQRLPHLLDYLLEATPDAICLQELKCLEDQFPREEIESAGYNVAVHGQKSFNGVAILSKRPFEATPGLPGDENDLQARYIEGVISGDNGVVGWRVSICPMAIPSPPKSTRINSPSWTG